VLFLVQAGACDKSRDVIVANISHWRDVDYADEAALKQAVALVGPISVGISAALDTFKVS